MRANALHREDSCELPRSALNFGSFYGLWCLGGKVSLGHQAKYFRINHFTDPILPCAQDVLKNYNKIGQVDVRGVGSDLYSCV